MSLTTGDYELLANHASSKFLENQIPLNESILKIAEVNDLNSDEIKRLVEAANTKTFHGLFKNAENKGKDIDFDVADAKVILSSYYPEAEKTASDDSLAAEQDPYEFYGDAPNMMRYVRHGSLPPEQDLEKNASVKTEKPNKHTLIARLRKVAQNMEEKIYDAEHEYVNGLGKLASELRKDYGPSYPDFEKKAQILYPGCTPILDDLRQIMYWKKPMEKVAEADRYVVEEDDNTKILGHILQAKMDQVKYAKACKTANQHIRELLK